MWSDLIFYIHSNPYYGFTEFQISFHSGNGQNNGVKDDSSFTFIPAKSSIGHSSGVLDLLADEIDKDHDVIEDDITWCNCD